MQSLGFDAAGKFLAGGDWSGNLFLWDVAAREQVGNLIGHGGIPFSLDFHPEKPLLLSGDRNDGTLRLWDVETVQSVGIGEYGDAGDLDGFSFSHVAFSPDGARAAAFTTWKVLIVDVIGLMESGNAASGDGDGEPPTPRD